MSMNLVPGAVPATYQHEERPHFCGVCRTPWGVSNPECPNRPRVSVQGHRGGA